MTVEFSLVLATISLAFGILGTVAGIKRSEKHDNKEDAAQLTTVIVKLENIGDDVKEIRGDMKSLKADVQNHAERLAKVEQRVDTLSNLIMKDREEDD